MELSPNPVGPDLIYRLNCKIPVGVKNCLLILGGNSSPHMTRNVRTVLSIRDVQGRNTKEARTEFFIFNLNKIAYHKMVVNHY